MTDQIFPRGVVHIARSDVDEGVLDHQVQDCPVCETELEQSFGMAGGGYGAYGYCPVCERVRWKVTCEEQSPRRHERQEAMMRSESEIREELERWNALEVQAIEFRNPLALQDAQARIAALEWVLSGPSSPLAALSALSPTQTGGKA